MIKTLISAIVFILFLPIFALVMIIGIIFSYITHSRNLYYPLIPLSSRLLMLVSFQWFSVKGQVPKKENGPYIFMFNHESMFDVFMLAGSIPYYINAIGQGDTSIRPCLSARIHDLGPACGRASEARSRHRHPRESCPGPRYSCRNS